jgi:hypothetical protein
MQLVKWLLLLVLVLQQLSRLPLQQQPGERQHGGGERYSLLLPRQPLHCHRQL